MHQHPTHAVFDMALTVGSALAADRQARRVAAAQASYDWSAVDAVQRLGSALRASRAREADLQRRLDAMTARALQAEGRLLRALG